MSQLAAVGLSTSAVLRAGGSGEEERRMQCTDHHPMYTLLTGVEKKTSSLQLVMRLYSRFELYYCCQFFKRVFSARKTRKRWSWLVFFFSRPFYGNHDVDVCEESEETGCRIKLLHSPG